MKKLVELKKEELVEIEGGWWHIVAAVGVAYTALYGAGYVLGVTGALLEDGYEAVTN